MQKLFKYFRFSPEEQDGSCERAFVPGVFTPREALKEAVDYTDHVVVFLSSSLLLFKGRRRRKEGRRWVQVTKIRRYIRLCGSVKHNKHHRFLPLHSPTRLRCRCLCGCFITIIKEAQINRNLRIYREFVQGVSRQRILETNAHYVRLNYREQETFCSLARYSVAKCTVDNRIRKSGFFLTQFFVLTNSAHQPTVPCAVNCITVF